MNLKGNAVLKRYKFLLIGVLVAGLVVGCGGGGGSSNNNGTTTATTTVSISPYKGAFSSGAVAIKDANGNAVSLVTGGTISSSGVANVTYSANVTYPLVVEVTGTFHNENTGVAEAATVPLRSLIVSSKILDVNNAVPVTIVTETAVADLNNRLGTVSSSNPITTTSAVTVLRNAGAMLGIPASTVPVFDPITHLSSDAGTLNLAALSVVANSQTGADLSVKVKALANRLATLGANAPTSIISQTAFNNALTAVTSGPNSVMIVGATAPTPVVINTSSYNATYATYVPTGTPATWGSGNWSGVDWQ